MEEEPVYRPRFIGQIRPTILNRPVARQAGLSKYLRSLGTSTISTVTSVFSRLGHPETRQRSRHEQWGSGRRSVMPIGTPSNAMAASMLLWRRSTNGNRKTRPPTVVE